jgi:hypothetical protein
MQGVEAVASLKVEAAVQKVEAVASLKVEANQKKADANQKKNNRKG